MPTPAISVLMSVFNGEAYLAEAVGSILAQTFGDFEFLIIDDGSTDKTAEMLAEYAKRDVRVRVLPQENIGRAESLNRGIHLVNASLIARMDADDVALPGRFERQVKFLAARPEIGLLGGTVEFITPEGRSIGVDRAPTEDAELRAAMLRYSPFRHPTVMMRKDVMLASGGYRKALRDVDDYDLFLRMAERTKMAILPEIVLRYRVHQNQASVQNMAHQVLCIACARQAAALRSGGLADPLSEVNEITAAFARKIGVSETELHKDLVEGHVYWIGLLAESQPDTALQLVESLLNLRESSAVDRVATAGALLRAAGIYLKRGEIARALATAGRGVFVQPIEAGKVAKMAITRRVRAQSVGRSAV